MASLAQMLGGKKNQDISDILYSSLFGNKKKPTKKTSPAQVKTTESSGDESQVALLRSIAANARISAKNSMALPSILSQTNIMQKNIAKLVKIQGSSPTTKADSFFSSSKFRENAYEAGYRKNLSSLTPTKAEPEKKQGFFSGLLSSVAGSIASFFSVGLMKIVIGGALLVGLGKYFRDPDFKSRMDEVMISFRDAIFSTEGWKNFKKGAAEVGKVLLAIVALKLAFKGLAAWISSLAMGGMGMPGGLGMPGGPAGKGGPYRDPTTGRYSKRPNLPWYKRAWQGTKNAAGWMRNRRAAMVGVGLTALGAGGYAYGANELDNWAEEESPSAGNITPQATGESPTASDMTPSTSPQQSSGTNWGRVAVNSALAGLTIVSAREMVSNIKVTAGLAKAPKTGSLLTRIKSLFTTARAKGWGARFLAKLPMKLGTSKVGKKVAQKLMAIAIGIFLPGPGWVGAIVSLMWLALDLYFLYDIFDSIITDIINEDNSVTSPTPQIKDPAYDSPSQRTSAPASSMPGYNPQTGFGNFMDRYGAGGVGGNFGGQKLSGDLPGLGTDFSNTDFSQVKDSIILHEGTGKGGRNPYETVFGYGKYGSPEKPLTDMTIREVLAFQDKLRNNTRGVISGGTSAVGAYQFLKDTLAKNAQIVFGPAYMSQKFTPETQDKLAQLNFDSAKKTPELLAKQWAYFRFTHERGGAALRAQSPGTPTPPPAGMQAPLAPPAPMPGPLSPNYRGAPTRPSDSIVPLPSYSSGGAPTVIDASKTVIAPPAGSPPPPAAQAMPAINNPELGSLLLKNEYHYS